LQIGYGARKWRELQRWDSKVKDGGSSHWGQKLRRQQAAKVQRFKKGWKRDHHRFV
jgi:hypothetical protein